MNNNRTGIENRLSPRPNPGESTIDFNVRTLFNLGWANGVHFKVNSLGGDAAGYVKIPYDSDTGEINHQTADSRVIFPIDAGMISLRTRSCEPDQVSRYIRGRAAFPTGEDYLGGERFPSRNGDYVILESVSSYNIRLARMK